MGTEAETLPNPSAHGVSLAQYAAVRAGLLEGLALDVVLAGAGVKPSRFSRAEDVWDERLAESGGGDGVLLRMFDAYLVDAQERYRRPIPPLDEDLRAWLDFVRCWAKHENPAALLRQLGLRANDLVRLHRAWMAKLAADVALGAEATKILEAEPGELPLPGLLTSVATAISAAASQLPADATDSEVEDDTDDVADSDEAEEQVVEAPPLFTVLAAGPLVSAIGVESAGVKPSARAHRPPLPQKPMGEAFQRPVALAPPRVVALGAVPSPDPAPVPAFAPPAQVELGETTAAPQMSPFAIVGDPRLEGLPFAPRAPGGPSGVVVPPKAAPPPTSPGPGKRSNLDQTVIAQESPLARGPDTGPVAPIRAASSPLPFRTASSALGGPPHTAVASPQPPAAAPPSSSVSLGETTAAPMMSPFAKVVDPQLQGLPFARSAPLAPTSGGAPPAPSGPAAPAPLIGSTTGDLPTDLIARIEKGAPPFPSAAPALPTREQPVGTTTGDLPTDLIARVAKVLPFESAPGRVAGPGASPARPESPFPQPPKPEPAPTTKQTAPNLTLEQYASLCAELSASPQQVDLIFRRHGFESANARLEVDFTWKERLKRSPGEYQEWQNLYRHYQAYWAEQSRRGMGR